ncbi:MAG: M28 family peptidase, partial [Hyphomicrobiaceae bacterium]
MSLHPRAVFFDLGDTLGSATLSRSPRRLERFDVYSFVPALLGQLRSDGHRLGIISNTGDDDGAHVDAVLANTGILPLFEPMLRIYSKDVGLKKDSPAIFGLAAQKAQLAPVQCVFVGEDSAERTVAAAAGFTTCPHPLLVREVIAGQVLRYARLSVRREEIDTDWRAALATLPLVPLHVTGTGGRVVYAIVGERAIPDLANRRFRADLLGAPGLPSSTDLYIFRDDAAAESGFLAPQGQAGMLFARGLGHVLLSSTDEGLVVALPPQVGPDDLHFEHTRHGHTLKLMPDPGLLAPLAAPAAPAAFAAPRAQAAPTLPAAVKAAFERIDAAAIADRIARFSGTKPPNDRGAAPIVSRHIAHPDNARAEALLAEELADCGRGRLTVQFHRFTHAGRTLHNVEAELAGATPEVVLVTAHLDSTAASSRPYDAVNDPAPGADDDCSGTAAVLTLAEHFAGLAAAAGPPQRT